MVYLNNHAAGELTLDELKEISEALTYELEVYIDDDRDKNYLLTFYHNRYEYGWHLVGEDVNEFYDTWEALCAPPIFEGKTLPEIVKRLTVYW